MLPVMDFFKLYESKDTVAFEALFHPDFYWIDGEMNTYSKTDYVGMLMSPDGYLPMKEYKITHIKETELGGDLALATYTSKVVFEGQNADEVKPCLETIVYRKHEGKWCIYHCRP